MIGVVMDIGSCIQLWHVLRKHAGDDGTQAFLDHRGKIRGAKAPPHESFVDP